MEWKNIINLKNLNFEIKNRPVKEYDIYSSGPISKEMASGKIYFDIKMLPPGTLSYPYHFHHVIEEFFLILDFKSIHTIRISYIF